MPTRKKFEVSAEDLHIILAKLEQLHHVRDLNTLLDALLTESRHMAHADAGSIFLAEGEFLKFSYVQNDTLFRNDFLSNKYIYSNQTVTIDLTSLAGYVAKTGDSLLIDDAYAIDSQKPYTFNATFDDISQYRTTSMLIVPLTTSKNERLGVLELINRLNDQGESIPFSEYEKNLVALFAFYASVAIERSLLLRDVVHKMLKMTQIRDPEETQPHVERVGAYAVEIYQRWAERHKVPHDEIVTFRDVLSTAAMLHDIGKVGIADRILQKNGPLTEEEYEQMKWHVIYGAEFFRNPHSEWDSLAYEITLNHHEKWDGTGYPGISRNDPLTIDSRPGKKGNAIPLSARIVALADVYDALISKRPYKDPWEEDKVLHHLRGQAGKHFDPEIVEIFFEIYDIIRAIRSKWEK